MTYGIGTRSYNRSTEKREMDRQRKEATERYLATPRESVTVPILCHCRSFLYEHSPKAHERLRSDFDWRHWSERPDYMRELAPTVGRPEKPSTFIR